MKVKIKKLVSEAIIPSYLKTGDAGMDLTAISMSAVDNKTNGYIEYKTGLAVEIPLGFVGLLYPRSSISKTGMILANSVGVLDSGYRGEISLRFKAIPNTDWYKVGDRVAQLIIIPHPNIEFEEVSELNDSERGEGGFGHTGK